VQVRVTIIRTVSVLSCRLSTHRSMVFHFSSIIVSSRFAALSTIVFESSPVILSHGHPRGVSFFSLSPPASSLYVLSFLQLAGEVG
jgi:hypothetical protein